MRIFLLFIIAVVITGGAAIYFVKHNHTPLLISHAEGHWIKPQRFVNFGTWDSQQPRSAIFQTEFVINQPLQQAALGLEALGKIVVYVDDKRVLASAMGTPYISKNIDLKPYANIGTHQLQVIVENNGALVLRAFSQALNINSSKLSEWKVSIDGRSWLAVDDVNHYQFPFKLKTTYEAYLSQWYVIALISSIALLFFYGKPKVILTLVRAENLRWLLMIILGILAVNNLIRLPLEGWGDVSEHYRYIEYIVNSSKLPLATEGWQMFQSPLYYLVSALFYKILLPYFSQISIEHWLRIIPLFCAIMQVQLAFYVVKLAFPQRNDLQVLGLMLAALMPMNIVESQFVGNESFTALFVGLFIILLLLLPQQDKVRWYWSQMGIYLGLALLSKASAILLLPVFIFIMLYQWASNAFIIQEMILKIFYVLGITFIICGWYYVRNWIMLGSPFVGGWDDARGITWWQDPGYRTLEYYISFGEVLIHPFYAAFHSVWDGLYASLWTDGYLSGRALISNSNIPPWNYDFASMSVLLSLFPMLGILFGLVFGYKTHIGRIAILLVLVYWGAIIAMSYAVPIYSTVKAQYSLGLIPIYAMLFAKGVQPLMHFSISRYLVWFVMINWSVVTYAAYFVV